MALPAKLLVDSRLPAAGFAPALSSVRGSALCRSQPASTRANARARQQGQAGAFQLLNVGGRFGRRAGASSRINASIPFGNAWRRQSPAQAHAPSRHLALVAAMCHGDRSGLDGFPPSSRERRAETGLSKTSTDGEEPAGGTDRSPAGRCPPRAAATTCGYRIPCGCAARSTRSMRALALQRSLVARACGTPKLMHHYPPSTSQRPLGHHLVLLNGPRATFASRCARAALMPAWQLFPCRTGFPLDREMTAQAARFAGPRQHLYSVSDVICASITMAAAQCALHLSRLAEEISSAIQPFGFVRLPSAQLRMSIMPRKRTPTRLTGARPFGPDARLGPLK